MDYKFWIILGLQFFVLVSYTFLVYKVGVRDGVYDGYFIAFLLLIIGFFSFIYSPTISLIVGTLIFILLGVFGVIFGDLSGKDYGVFFVLAVITFLIANVKSSSGVNR